MGTPSAWPKAKVPSLAQKLPVAALLVLAVVAPKLPAAQKLPVAALPALAVVPAGVPAAHLPGQQGHLLNNARNPLHWRLLLP